MVPVFFCFIGNGVAFPIKQKALRGMRTRAKKKYVASDRARRENVPRHILFYFIGNCVAFPIKQKSAPRGSHCGGTEFVASRPAAGGESCQAGSYFMEKDKLWTSPDGVLPQFFSFRIFVLFVEPDECLRNTLLAEGKFC